MSQMFRVFESLLVTHLTNNLLSFIACFGPVDSLTVASVIIFPIFQLGNKTMDIFSKIISMQHCQYSVKETLLYIH